MSHLRRAINDSYNMDICLMYPPYIIALGMISNNIRNA